MKIIRYQFMRDHNEGTENNPNIVRTFHDCEIRCANEYFEANYAIAEREAYNGEIIVEDDGRDEPEETPNIETRVEIVETKTAELEESLEMLLTGVTSDE